MCFLAQLYIWRSMRSLRSRCIGIPILIRVLYIRLQIIYHSAVLSKSSAIAMSPAQTATKAKDTTYLLIRSGGIS